MGKYVILILSLVLMLIVSAIGAVPALCWGFSWGNYFAVFFILTALQLFLGRLWNYFVNRKERLQMEQVNAANALADAVQYLQVVCAYCGTTNLVKILIGEENKYDCEACSLTNSVQISTSSARITKPIMPKSELADIFKSIDDK